MVFKCGHMTETRLLSHLTRSSGEKRSQLSASSTHCWSSVITFGRSACSLGFWFTASRSLFKPALSNLRKACTPAARMTRSCSLRLPFACCAMTNKSRSFLRSLMPLISPTTPLESAFHSVISPPCRVSTNLTNRVPFRSTLTASRDINGPSGPRAANSKAVRATNLRSPVVRQVVLRIMLDAANRPETKGKAARVLRRPSTTSLICSVSGTRLSPLAALASPFGNIL
mmetsp:Transcript_6100/g.10586  ORF Transcript_6100/g.10586 Transcript_6100/m.10586 type:complete len:228 (+) Transcript_6100:931-1614(+)